MTDVSKETYVMERDILYGLADSLCHVVLMVRGPSGRTDVSKEM